MSGDDGLTANARVEKHGHHRLGNKDFLEKLVQGCKRQPQTLGEH